MKLQAEVKIARQQDIFFLKLYGALKFDQSSALENCLSRLKNEQNIKNVCIDLTSVSIMDSTILGQLAQIGIYCSDNFSEKAVILAHHPDLLSLLLTVAFEKIFVILSDETDDTMTFEPIAAMAEPDHTLAERVLGAHQTLMQISPQNYREFKHVVSLLEQDFNRFSR